MLHFNNYLFFLWISANILIAIFFMEHLLQQPHFFCPFFLVKYETRKFIRIYCDHASPLFYVNLKTYVCLVGHINL